MSFQKTLFFLALILVLFVTCSKDTLPDPIEGEWDVYSLTDSNGTTTVWEELYTNLVALVPGYSCMQYTASISETLVTTNYIFVDVTTTGCIDPIVFAYTWKKQSGDDYVFSVGNDITTYSVTFSNNDRQMTWKNKATHETTTWNRR